MTDDQLKDIEDWDPDEARARMEASRLKMPVTFRRDDMDLPNMEMEPVEPKPARTERTAPKIVDISKNKNKLF
jgi:hypothetical protein